MINDYYTWWDYIKEYGNEPGSMQVDQRLIHRMAPNIPARFNGLDKQSLPEPIDARLALANLPCTPITVLSCIEGIDADYVYLGYVSGPVNRGIWMQSPFIHRRYVLVSYAVPVEVNIGQALPHVLAAENDLMIAEALLEPVLPRPQELLAAIEYERDVELLNTAAIALFDRRRVDGLQPYQWRHLPVPGSELVARGLPHYTYGGGGQPDM